MAVGQWKHIVDSDELQRSSHTVCAVNGKAYIFGGELLPREPRDNTMFVVQVSDSNAPSGGRVMRESAHSETVPSPRVGSASAELGGKLYFFSGRGGTAMQPIEEHGQLYCYDPTGPAWTIVKPADSSSLYPPARSYHCMTSDSTSILYLHAGCPESGRLSDLWSFNIDTRKWTQLPEAPAPQRGGTSIAYLDKKLYRMNGFDGKKEQGGAVDVFDVSSEKWSTNTFDADGKSGPEPRSVGALVPVRTDGKDKLLTLFGERDPSDLGHAGAGKMLADWWIYDIGSQTWEAGHQQSGVAPVARGWFDAAALDDRNVVVSGGLGESNDRLGDVWVLSL